MRDESFMKEKPVLGLVLSMSLPMVISMLVNALYNIIDSYFVAKISEDAMTALSLVYPVQNFVNAVAIGFGVGINAVIAVHLGAGYRDKADKAATQGILLSVVHGILFTVACIAIMPWFMARYTDNAQIIDLGVRYSTIVFGFSIIINLGLVFEKVFQSVGNMKVTMIALMAGCIVNIILDPLFIFGIGPFPKMNIEGAALATGIGQTVTLAIYLVVYFTRPISVKIRKKYFKPDKSMIGKLYAIGVPAILNLALPSILISSLNAILAAFSQTYVFVLGVYYKLQTFLYLTANGLVQGMRPLIGYNYGAREYKRVKKIYTVVLSLSAVIMLDTIACGATALRIISGGFVVSAVSVTSSGALEGLNKGVPSLIISLMRYMIVIVPAAFLLSRVFGATGVWHAFWIAELITAVCAFFIYKRSVKVKTA